MAITISSNGYSVGDQVGDSLAFLEQFWPALAKPILLNLPAYDPELPGYDDEALDWIITDIEATDKVRWIEGEPWGVIPSGNYEYRLYNWEEE